ncbi:stage III sporulation protein AG [Effusibacillus pohliae]|uniref:stage III sporulation protein AG n=1 Tax=Effusibacillus pohliae TaxID=232270 RepID=UPI000376AED0|nr:stage III sporulation protein AG [Effusibacillus pohliae]
MNLDFGFLSRLPKWTYLLGALGLILLLFGSFQAPEKYKPSESLPASTEINTDRQAISEYERLYEQKLTQILNQIQGVSDVTVMVNLDSTEEKVYYENLQNQKQTTRETDKQGGQREITTFNENKQMVLTKGSPDQPVVIKTVKPHVRGVLVVARGAEQPRIQQMMMESIQRVLEVPMHRIAIQPKKAN